MSVKTIRSYAHDTKAPTVERPVANGVTLGDGDFVTLVGSTDPRGQVQTPGTSAIFGRVDGGPNDNLVSRNYRAPLSTGNAALSRTVLVELSDGEEFEITVNGLLATDAPGKYYKLANGGGTASVLLTSDATAPANNDTVTVGGVTYTFKTTLTPAANEVLINTTAAAALTNLKRAITLTGTAGTDYGSATVLNPLVTGGTLTTTTLLITATDLTASGTALAATETSAHLSFDEPTLYGGPTDQRIDNLSKSSTTGQFLCVSRKADSAGNYTIGRFVVSAPQDVATAF